YVQASERLGLSRSGWGWDTRLVDLNNDGTLEAIQATGFLRGGKGKVNRWPELQALGTSNDSLLRDPRFWPRLRTIPPYRDDISGDDTFAFFVRARDGRFYDLAHKVKLDELPADKGGPIADVDAEGPGLSKPMNTRGIAVADVDGDGRIDFAVANQWQNSFI